MPATVQEKLNEIQQLKRFISQTLDAEPVTVKVLLRFPHQADNSLLPDCLQSA